MTLIKSISGIRGTIGGTSGQNLTPLDIVECVAGYGQWLLQKQSENTVVVGRDGRISGPMVSQLAMQTLIAMGINVIDLELSTTPTVELMVPKFNATGGIIFTASHNPKEWNALKFLNHEGEFISATDGEEIIAFITKKELHFSEVDNLGSITKYTSAVADHVDMILNLSYLNIDKIKERKFHCVVDCINSTGAISIPPLLEKLACTYTLIHDKITGDFAHNPEPLPKHLADLSDAVKLHKADLGISVDPDVDRLAFVCEDGSKFGEEYSLVAIADFMLSQKAGNTVSNLSSTRALADITRMHGGSYTASAVGEVNVVNQMKASNAVIGGEGNGGIILPDLHYGRDALVGIALMLNLLADKKMSLSDLRKSYPQYEIVKQKIALTPQIDINKILTQLKEKYKHERINTVDGLKIDFDHGWVHLRKSNTEAIIRVYAEAKSSEEALSLAKMINQDVETIIQH